MLDETCQACQTGTHLECEYPLNTKQTRETGEWLVSVCCCELPVKWWDVYVPHPSDSIMIW